MSNVAMSWVDTGYKRMEGKEVLIIDANRDFCLLMQFYLQKRNCTVTYVFNQADGLSLIDSKLPSIIIANNNLAHDMQQLLQEKIDLIPGYAPDIYIIKGNETSLAHTEDDGTLLDELKKWFQSLKKSFK